MKGQGSPSFLGATCAVFFCLFVTTQTALLLRDGGVGVAASPPHQHPQIPLQAEQLRLFLLTLSVLMADPLQRSIGSGFLTPGLIK